MSRRLVLLMILSVVIITAAGIFGAYAQVGVETGDWIEFEYTVAGVSGISLPTWMRVEFLSVEETNATVKVTIHMSDGTEHEGTVTVEIVTDETEQDERMIVKIVPGGGGPLSGLIIPANCKTGDSVHVSEYDSITIDGETTKSYAGARRTVIYASFSESGTELTYYWDKQTGIMVGSAIGLGDITVIAKATETNMWQAQPLGLPIDPTVFYGLIVVAIAIAATAVTFLIRRKQKPAEEIVPSPPTPPSAQPPMSLFIIATLQS